MWSSARFPLVASACFALISALFTGAAMAAAPQVADCEHGPVMIGSGSPDWRRASLAAGPLGVARRPLSRMSETRNGDLITKMPALVEGQSAVTLTVPAPEQRRVFLYYGISRDAQGRRTSVIGATRGYSAVSFEPCSDRPRTIWPGGIRVRGRRPVRLTVTVQGSVPIPLRLGRPHLYSRSG